MLREHLRLCLRDVGKSVLQRVGDHTMNAPSCRTRHRFVGGVTHEGVLEHVALYARRAAGMRETGVQKLPQILAQLSFVLRHDHAEELVPELAPESGGDLRRLAGSR